MTEHPKYFSAACAAARERTTHTYSPPNFSAAYAAASARIVVSGASVIFSAAYAAASIGCYDRISVGAFSAAYAAASTSIHSDVRSAFFSAAYAAAHASRRAEHAGRDLLSRLPGGSFLQLDNHDMGLSEFARKRARTPYLQEKEKITRISWSSSDS